MHASIVDAQVPEMLMESLSEEIYQAALELDLLIQASYALETAYASLAKKMECANG